jgi:hypothetical protein
MARRRAHHDPHAAVGATAVRIVGVADGGAGPQRHITLSPLLSSILDLLNLPHSIYTDLARLPAQ